MSSNLHVASSELLNRYENGISSVTINVNLLWHIQGFVCDVLKFEISVCARKAFEYDGHLCAKGTITRAFIRRLIKGYAVHEFPVSILQGPGRRKKTSNNTQATTAAKSI